MLIRPIINGVSSNQSSINYDSSSKGAVQNNKPNASKQELPAATFTKSGQSKTNKQIAFGCAKIRLLC